MLVRLVLSDADDQHDENPILVPMFVLHDDDTNNDDDVAASIQAKTLHRTIETFQNECQATLQALGQSLEIALQSEEDLGLSSSSSSSARRGRLSESLQRRIDSLAECFQINTEVLQDLLQPFPIVQMLKTPPTCDAAASCTEATTIESQSTAVAFFKPSQNTKKSEKSTIEPYDSAAQILAHLVRDWSVSGATIRASLYDWCLDQVRSALSTLDRSTPVRLLVPGAGLGRLAWQLAVEPGLLPPNSSVQALECSWCMAAVAHRLFQDSSSQATSAKSAVFNDDADGSDFSNATSKKPKWDIYPYVVDQMRNQVDSQEQTKFSVPIPDTTIREKLSDSPVSLSYLLGDFTKLRHTLVSPRPEDSNAFDIVVTCFFVDTASNVYDYLSTIRNVLQRTKTGTIKESNYSRSGGIWINVGPLHWHANAQLQPSADELFDMIVNMGFRIEHWSVDVEPIEYRNRPDTARSDKNPPRSTYYDAYRPLRFVAILEGY